jgi:hypothetical protein
MDKLDSGYEIFTILQVVFLVLLFCVGSVIQVQLILVSYKELDTAWKITITHSIVMIVHFAFSISFDTVTHFIPFLSQYTGNWICYAAYVLIFYGHYSIVAYSLLVSILKYVFIVHHVKTLKWGKDTIKQWFFFTNLFHPLFVTILSLLKSDYQSHTFVHSCFGKTEERFRQYNTSVSSLRKVFGCPLKNSEEDSSWYAYYVTEQCVCILQSIINIVFNSNLLEGFFYYKIFKKMRR